MERKPPDFGALLKDALSSNYRAGADVGDLWSPLGFDPFPDRALGTDAIDEWFVDREEDLSALLRMFAITRTAAAGRFALLGPPGVGRTSLINAMVKGLELNRHEIEQTFGERTHALAVSMEDLVKQGGGNELLAENQNDRDDDPFFRFSESLGRQVKFLMIDDCDRHWQILPQYLAILKHQRPDLSVLSVLTPSVWRRLLRDSGFLESLAMSRTVHPMPQEAIVTLLEVRLGHSLLFEAEALERIAKASGGVPRIAILAARRSLLAAKQRSLEKVDVNIVEEILSVASNIELAWKTVRNLTETEREIAQTFLDAWDGLSAAEVGDIWKIDRSTAVGHLSAMHTKGALTRMRYGRKVRYGLDVALRIVLELELIHKKV